MRFWNSDGFCDNIDNSKYVNLQYSRSDFTSQTFDALGSDAVTFFAVTLALDSTK